jgi:hypothetical protein
MNMSLDDLTPDQRLSIVEGVIASYTIDVDYEQAVKDMPYHFGRLKGSFPTDAEIQKQVDVIRERYESLVDACKQSQTDDIERTRRLAQSSCSNLREIIRNTLNTRRLGNSI